MSNLWTKMICLRIGTKDGFHKNLNTVWKIKGLREYMRIEKLFVKTAKKDQTKDSNLLENRMERASFIKRYDNTFFYTPLGLLLRNNIENYIVNYIEGEGFVEGHLPNITTLSSMIKETSLVNNILVSSYKDLPLKLYYREVIEFNREYHLSLWQTKAQRVIGFSTAEYDVGAIKLFMNKLMASLKVPMVFYERTYYFPHFLAKESFKKTGESDDKSTELSRFDKVEPIKIETPMKKTVQEVCKFLSIPAEDLLKTMIFADDENDFGVIVLGSNEIDLIKLTRVLGLPEGSLKPKVERALKEDLNLAPGYLGPSGLKVSRILIDHHVVKDKPYIAGANEENYHIKGIIYGRDYKGDFYDLVKDHNEENGWVMGELREDLPMLRVQNAQSGLDYVSLQAGYINIDRLMLAICQLSMKEEGFIFPKNIGWFDIVVTMVDRRDEEASDAAKKVYQTILEAGFNVVMDGRNQRMGSKFNDYDLISIPYRVIVGKNFREGFDLKDYEGNLVSVNFENLVATLERAVLESKIESVGKTEEKNETL